MGDFNNRTDTVRCNHSERRIDEISVSVVYDAEEYGEIPVTYCSECNSVVDVLGEMGDDGSTIVLDDFLPPDSSCEHPSETVESCRISFVFPNGLRVRTTSVTVCVECDGVLENQKVRLSGYPL